MPLIIEDDATVALVVQLARALNLTEAEAVRVAATAELERLGAALPLRERFAALRARHPLPAPTGKMSDKAFFDDLNGD
jgi:antitoxin VapB